MSSSINLVSNKNVVLEKELERLRILRITALVSLVIVLSASILVFVLNLTLPLGSVKKDQQMTIVNISLQHKKLVTYTLISDRVKKLSSIISQRKNYVSQINEVLGKVPGDVSVGALEIQLGKMTMSVSATSLEPINKFIDDIVVLGNKGKVLKNIIIQGLSLDVGSGKYTLSMQANIP
jgi:hypothetical protein